MSKIVLNDVTNLNALSVINDNFDKLEQELQTKVLYRDNPDGEPNTLENDVDANGNSLYNIQDLTIIGSFTVNGLDIEEVITEATQGIEDNALAAQNAATAAGISAASAGASATAADASEANALASENAAASSESNASSSATAAATQAGIATTKASEASTSASNAATSASNAAASVTAAQTAETNAETAQAAAESARDATLAAYDSFDDRYLGAKAVDPILDNDGNPLQAGELYFNTVSGSMKVYTGTLWVDSYADGNTLLAKAANLSDLANVTTARDNLGVEIGVDVQAYSAQLTSYAAHGVGMRNRIINGAMVIDQRNAGASVTQTTASLYVTDRFLIRGSVTSKFTGQQSSTAPAGFVNSLLCTSSSAYSVGSAEAFFTAQSIEGNNVADFGWGTANAATVTLSFWVRSSLTGTFGGAVSNYAGDRSYPFTYTISAANTWEQKSVTIAGDTSGTWVTNSGGSVAIQFGLGVGSTLSGTANTWAGALYRSATGATSVVGTNGATFYITGVQLEKGSTATSFDYRPYGTELALCQRYYEVMTLNVPSVAAPFTPTYGYKVTKRTTPTFAGGGSGFNMGGSTDSSILFYQTTSATQTVTATSEL